ncbi:MAG: hypothetical protein SF123_02450 [Chloroflexota bacterium]|nr:hypothetical protein [Chloroflexota bacterium]
MNPHESLNVYFAVRRIMHELPEILGADDWKAISPQIEASMLAYEQSTTDDQRQRIGEELETLFWKTDKHANKRLLDAMEVQSDIIANTRESVESLVKELKLSPADVEKMTLAALQSVKWDVDPETITPKSDETHRGLSMKPGGGGAKSIKFKNLRFDVNDWLKMGGAGLTGAYGFMDSPHPYVLIGAAVVLAATLLEASTRTLSEPDASVFWGFVVAASHKPERIADEAVIFAKTNEERTIYYHAPLTDAQFQRSLLSLEAMHSIRRVSDRPNHWQIVEQFSIKD